LTIWNMLERSQINSPLEHWCPLSFQLPLLLCLFADRSLFFVTMPPKRSSKNKKAQPVRSTRPRTPLRASPRRTSPRTYLRTTWSSSTRAERDPRTIKFHYLRHGDLVKKLQAMGAPDATAGGGTKEQLIAKLKPLLTVAWAEECRTATSQQEETPPPRGRATSASPTFFSTSESSSSESDEESEFSNLTLSQVQFTPRATPRIRRTSPTPTASAPAAAAINTLGAAVLHATKVREQSDLMGIQAAQTVAETAASLLDTNMSTKFAARPLFQCALATIVVISLIMDEADALMYPADTPIAVLNGPVSLFMVAEKYRPGTELLRLSLLTAALVDSASLPQFITLPASSMVLSILEPFAADMISGFPGELRDHVDSLRLQALTADTASGAYPVSEPGHRSVLAQAGSESQTSNAGSPHVVKEEFTGKLYNVHKPNPDLSFLAPTVLLRRMVPDSVLKLASHHFPVYAKVTAVVTALFRELDLHHSSTAFHLSCDEAFINPSQITDRTTIAAFRNLVRFGREYLTSMLVQLLTEGFASRDGQFNVSESVSLVSFLVPVPHGEELRRDHLEDALRNFQRVMELLGGHAYSGVCSTVIDKIMTHEWDTDRWSPQYIRYCVEHQLYTAFHLLRDVDSHSISKIEGLMTHDQTGVARLIKHFLDQTRFSIDHRNSFEQSAYVYWGGCAGSPLSVTGRRLPASKDGRRSSTPASAGSVIPSQGTPRSPTGGYCVYHVASLLDLTENCQKNPCRHKHFSPEAFRSLSAAELKKLLDEFASLRRPSDKEYMFARTLINKMIEAATKKGLLPKPSAKKPAGTTGQ
jgi:hypothetical protein